MAFPTAVNDVDAALALAWAATPKSDTALVPFVVALATELVAVALAVCAFESDAETVLAAVCAEVSAAEAVAANACARARAVDALLNAAFACGSSTIAGSLAACFATATAEYCAARSAQALTVGQLDAREEITSGVLGLGSGVVVPEPSAFCAVVSGVGVLLKVASALVAELCELLMVAFAAIAVLS